jgi:hypothetical protein
LDAYGSGRANALASRQPVAFLFFAHPARSGFRIEVQYFTRTHGYAIAATGAQGVINDNDLIQNNHVCRSREYF